MAIGKRRYPAAAEAGLVGRPGSHFQSLPKRVVVPAPADLFDPYAGGNCRAMAWIEVIDRAVVFGAPGRGGEQPIDQDMRVGPQALATERSS